MAGTLTFPDFMFGPYKEASRLTGRMVTKVLKSGSLEPVWGAPTVEVGTDSLIVLDRRWSSISSTAPHLHPDLLWKTLDRRLVKRQQPFDVFFEFARAGFASPATFVGLLALQEYRIAQTSSDQRAFVEAAVKHWETLLSVGPRYSVGLSSGTELSEMHSLLAFCLANLGAPHDQLRSLTAENLQLLFEELPATDGSSA